MLAIQPALITGYYRCHNCGRDVRRTRRVRRFRLCDECLAVVAIPDDLPAGSEEQLRAGGEFWAWYSDMEKRYPAKRVHRVSARPLVAYSLDAYWPTCECGRRRKELGRGTPGVFGGPFGRWCPVCDARQSVESLANFATKLYPDRDDEEWLDLLYQSHREAFEVGVLPDYWFELRRRRDI